MSLGYRDRILRAAGFLDGDGCFRYTPLKHREAVSGTHTIEATQKEREPLDELALLFGGAIKLFPNRKTGKSYYQWYIHGPNARGVMMMLYPFMTSRRKGQIKLALSRPWSQRVQRPRSFRRSLAGQLVKDDLVFRLAL